ncbi:MAG: beta-eliminating lyase-related protein, partial [Pseudomonadota bacterium]
MTWFTSDNASGAHPKVIEAVTRANDGFSGSYGDDAHMDQVRSRIREIFEAPEAEVFLVATGTAANALSLASMVAPWSTVFTHEISHLEVDECGAPEFYTGGASLSLVPGAQGKMSPEALAKSLAKLPDKVVHHRQLGALSLTQVTEFGGVYTLDELRALTDQARAYGLPVHMDGARFTNALVALGCTAAEMTWKSGIDVLSFGGTKNGLLGAEAVVMFDPARAWEFELRRKRGAHLFSKHRYLSAQMAAYLEDDLWLEMGRAANTQAATLARGLDIIAQHSNHATAVADHRGDAVGRVHTPEHVQGAGGQRDALDLFVSTFDQ